MSVRWKMLISYQEPKEIGFSSRHFNLLPRISALDNVAIPLIYAGITKKRKAWEGKACLTNGWTSRQNGITDPMNYREVNGNVLQLHEPLSIIPQSFWVDEPTGNLDLKLSKHIFSEIHSAETCHFWLLMSPILLSMHIELSVWKMGVNWKWSTQFKLY